MEQPEFSAFKQTFDNIFPVCMNIIEFVCLAIILICIIRSVYSFIKYKKLKKMIYYYFLIAVIVYSSTAIMDYIKYYDPFSTVKSKLSISLFTAVVIYIFIKNIFHFISDIKNKQ